MATVAEKLLTAEEFARLPDNGQPMELVRGRIVLLNVPRPRHGEICAQIVYLMRRYLDGHPAGRIICNDSGVITERNPDSVRGPDVAFHSSASLPEGPLPYNSYLPAVPEVVFEVRSHSDRWIELQAKAAEYLKAGVKVVCVLDPPTETVLVCTADAGPRTFSADDELVFPGLLDGFRVPVRRFFE